MQRLEWKRNIGRLWPSKSSGRKIILLYHSVGDTAWAISEKKFQEQLSWLADNCRVLSLSNLIEAETNDELQVAITFDDGYVSLYDQVLPLLNKNKLSATVYINTGWIGQNDADRKLSDASLGHYPDDAFLIWKEVKALHHAGWEIGSHGINHYNFALAQHDLILKELTESKQHIEEQLNLDCIHFAYPWGRHSPELKKIVAKLGYRYAAGARHGAMTEHSDMFAFPRMNIEQHYSLDDFKNIMKGKWDYLGWIHYIKGL